MTNIDFHIHGKIGSSLSFDKDEFMQKILAAKKSGLDAFALTEHSHAVNFSEAFVFLDANFDFIENYWDADEIKIFPGTEITTLENLDIIVIDLPKNILELAKQFDEKLTRTTDELLNLLDNSALVILAHPYRRHDVFPKLSDGFLRRLDATEINAKDFYEKQNEGQVRELATKLNLPILANSDTHHFASIGATWNEFESDIKTINELKENIRRQNFTIHISDDIGVKVKSGIDSKADHKLRLKLGISE